MDTAPSSADNTDHEEKFEDANDTNGDAADSPIDGEHLKSPPEPDDQKPRPPSLPPRTSVDEKPSAEAVDGQDHTQEESTAPPSVSPLLTAHRMSRDSTVPTAEDDASVRSIPSITTTAEKDLSDGRFMKPLPRPSRFQGFSAALPSVPWAAPPKPSAVPVRERSPQFPPGVPRKPTNPFAWLGRAASKDITSPPLPPKSHMDARRNTAASISTIGSNADLNLKALDDGQENGTGARAPARNSLKEKFKMLRMREEAGIMATSLDDSEESKGGAIAGLVGRTTSLSIGIASPESMTDDKEEALKSPVLPRSPAIDGLPSPTINHSLTSGQVQGVAESAADACIPIDWDFWQSVVNEGPAAVARTSPEELTNAIAGGIPQTIRGVIWQVLANSKNEELELVYHDLLNRGTNIDGKDVSSPSTATNGTVNGSLKESVASSSSSVHSESSTPATSANVGAVSPSLPHETAEQDAAKLRAKLTAERQKKVKDDAAALSKLEKMIKRDMGARTSYSKYAVAAGFQDGLFNVCKAYALFDEAVGYPQGMNFIIMPILFTMPEEEAFCLLVRLMNKYQLRDLFIQDMPGLHLHLYQFERLLEDLEPALYCHLNRRQVTPKLYATQWFLTMFAYRFPLQLVMRVYDLVLSEGLEGAILKFGMAVIQRNVSQLLAMNDMMALTNFLKEKVFDVYIDAKPSSNSILESGFFGMSGGSETEVYRADLLVQDACAVKVTPEQLNKYREEWEEKLASDKAREAEIENYRNTVTTQTTKIRSLEDRASLADTEHVQIASDLVRLKVENQELLDSNESLKGQVDELRKVAESEAKNVEDRLKAEMERVMTRNIEVQNENRHMEESMAEMERSLVETKMKYAEINNDHETLKQKWMDLRKAIGPE